MFNRQALNRGKFNRTPATKSTGKEVFFYGTVEMKLDAKEKLSRTRGYNSNVALKLSADANLSAIKSYSAKVKMNLSANGRLTRTRPLDGHIDLTLSVGGHLTRLRNLSGAVVLQMQVRADEFHIYRSEFIDLQGITIMPGGLLVIELKEMIVSLNENHSAIKHLTRESDFFLFMPGVNELTYTNTSQQGLADMRVQWHDAWK
ncbi:MAG: hypothetical protein FWC13_05380 [Oscillospiraceae bacterium]|nr:hypothetical protein [Oscillospiraceae bacterium]